MDDRSGSVTVDPHLDDTGLLLTEVMDRLGPVAVMTALRDCDDTIVDFRYEYVNQAFCDTLGEPAEALVGHRLLELYPSHVELGLFTAYCDVVDTGEPYVDELPWFDERNLQAFLEVRVVPFRDGYLLTGQDITARRMGEQVQRIFDSSHDGIVAVDLQLRITAWNAGAERLFGLTEHEAVGRHLSICIPEHLRAEDAARLTAAMAEPDGVATFVTDRVHPDGTVQQVEVSAAPIVGASGSVVGASLVHRPLGTRRSSPADGARVAQQTASATPPDEASVEVEVWVRSTGRWAPGFRVEGHQPDGSVLVRRTTDRDLLPQSFPRELVRPVRRRRSNGW